MRFVAALLLMVTTSAMAADVPLDQLTKGQTIQGFRVDAVYLNDSNQPMGARFIHDKSGFTLDLLQIESVPQAYTWVSSIPVSEQGEPHTQEHLLLAKGTTGRAFASLDTMSLSRSRLNAIATMKTTSIPAMIVRAARVQTPRIRARPASSSSHGITSALIFTSDAGRTR